MLATLTKMPSIAIVTVTLMLCGQALGQVSQQGYPPAQPVAQEAFRAYTLRSVPAGEVYGQAMQSLSTLPTRTEVVVDERGNRLLVNGTPQAHQIMQRLVESLDRAPAAAQPAPGATSVESYPVPAAQQSLAIGDLRVRFPAQWNVQVAADPPRNQLLVAAPPALHPQIAAFLRSRYTNAPSVEELTRPNASLMHLGRVAGQVVPIESAWEVIQAKLQRVWGNRMAVAKAVATDPRAAAVATYTVQLTDGNTLRLEFDPAAKQVMILGPNDAASNCARLISVLDHPPREPGISSQILPLGKAKKETIEQAISAVRGAAKADGKSVRTVRPWDASGDGAADARRAELVSMLFQKPPAGGKTPATGEGDLPPKHAPGGIPALSGGLIGNVEVYIIPELDLIILIGRDQDVKQIEALIEAIVSRTEESTPEVEVYPLKHVDSEALATIVTQLYSSVFTARSGTVNITPLVKPNALLLIGQASSIKTAIDLIKRLDQPGTPDAQFEIFRLKHMSARNAQDLVQRFYGALPGPRATVQDAGQPIAANQPQLPGLFPRLHVIADFRSNALIVRGAARDLADVAKLIASLDRPDAAAELAIKIFPLKNSLANELAAVLQNAISPPLPQGQQGGGGQPQQIQIPGVQLPNQGQGPQGQNQGARAGNLESRSTALRLLTLDAKSKEILTSGILIDVQVTADPRANAVIVKAPEQSMPLIGKLIEELDRIPGAEAKVKVFTVVNGDAQSLVQMLVALFGQQTTTGQQLQVGPIGPAGQPGAAQTITGTAQGDSALVPLRFAVDTRTNSILATGSAGDLDLVELILDHISQSDVKDRKTNVYRLRNAPADQVAQAINQFLQNERAVTNLAVPSSFEQIQQEVVVVPEIVTNSLIISATPRFYNEIEKIIEDLDRLPPMVMIQVLIAEVALNNTDEFGVELGLQDSILFDRSLIGQLVTTNTVTQNQTGGQVQQTNVISSVATPGFAFNNQPLGQNPNNNTGRFGTQALSNFSVGRVNGELGYGGLVLSASNESVSVLIRALQECRRLDILSRPQIATLNNQPAFVQVGQRVRFINSTTINAQNGSQTNTLSNPENVGLILGVTPRVSDDGRVAMEIDVEKSEVGPEAEGIPITVLNTGDVIRSPRINTTTAQTTINAVSGQTIVLGGLITTNKTVTHRRVPLLASIPVLGHLFRYDAEFQRKTELLIILTPRVIWNEGDAELIKQVESARISWVLSDVHKLHGVRGLNTRWNSLDCHDLPTVYPDANPRGEMCHEGGMPVEMHGQGAIHGNGNGFGRIPSGVPNGTPRTSPGPNVPNGAVPNGAVPSGAPGARAPTPPQGRATPGATLRNPPAAANRNSAPPTRLPAQPSDGPVISAPQGTPTNARLPGINPSQPSAANRPNLQTAYPLMTPPPGGNGVYPAGYQALQPPPGTGNYPPPGAYAGPEALLRPQSFQPSPQLLGPAAPPVEPTRRLAPIPMNIPAAPGSSPTTVPVSRPWGD